MSILMIFCMTYPVAVVFNYLLFRHLIRIDEAPFDNGMMTAITIFPMLNISGLAITTCYTIEVHLRKSGIADKFFGKQD